MASNAIGNLAAIMASKGGQGGKFGGAAKFFNLKSQFKDAQRIMQIKELTEQRASMRQRQQGRETSALNSGTVQPSLQPGGQFTLQNVENPTRSVDDIKEKIINKIANGEKLTSGELKIYNQVITKESKAASKGVTAADVKNTPKSFLDSGFDFLNLGEGDQERMARIRRGQLGASSKKDLKRDAKDAGVSPKKGRTRADTNKEERNPKIMGKIRELRKQGMSLKKIREFLIESGLDPSVYGL